MENTKPLVLETGVLGKHDTDSLCAALHLLWLPIAVPRKEDTDAHIDQCALGSYVTDFSHPQTICQKGGAGT